MTALVGIELRRAVLPLVAPFETSFGVDTVRDALLVRVETRDGEGWGECVAMRAPLYSSQYVDMAADVISRFFVPLLARSGAADAVSAARALGAIKGHRMAKAAVEMALLDAELTSHGIPLTGYLAGTREKVAVGVSVGIAPSIPELLDTVAGYLHDGYLRIKLKIKPGWDIEPVKAVRERFGDIDLQVDANTAYTPADIRHLARLDDFHLTLIEQPFDEDDLLGHAELAGAIRTPVCLDESIESARAAAAAIQLGACGIVNIKTGRVGGLLEARRIHDVCQAHGVPVWCGSMLETGIGRAANVALASLPGFVLPGDTSASARYFAHDIVTEPFVLDHGHLRVPTGPGLGIRLDRAALDAVTTSRAWCQIAED
jgi:O-succinylbenzoate synthase